MNIDEIILKCQIGEEHLDQAEYEQVARWLEELEVYKKALEYIDKILVEHCQFSLECVIHCGHKFGSCDCVRKGMWAEWALQKAKELSEGS